MTACEYGPAAGGPGSAVTVSREWDIGRNVSEMPNRLASETSPYLLQHAENPVDWYPWGDEAFARARAEDKPVLVSIGYAACHWCHVMEHESFEDAEVAQVMNDALRVREGRPRGAPGRRRDLHGRRPGHDRPGRLAAERVPHARGRAVLRRHLLPARAAARAAVVAGRCWSACANAWTTQRTEIDEAARHERRRGCRARRSWRRRDAEVSTPCCSTRRSRAAAPVRRRATAAGAARRSSRRPR